MGLLADMTAGGVDPHADVPPTARAFARLRETLDEEDRAVLDEWLAAPIPVPGQTNYGVGTKTICERLREAGHRVTETQVVAYRRWLRG